MSNVSGSEYISVCVWVFVSVCVGMPNLIRYIQSNFKLYTKATERNITQKKVEPFSQNDSDKPARTKGMLAFLCTLCRSVDFSPGKMPGQDCVYLLCQSALQKYNKSTMVSLSTNRFAASAKTNLATHDVPRCRSALITCTQTLKVYCCFTSNASVSPG